ncbi:MAG: hypothetical protein IKJ77_02670 [Firmicutes bacterium]|nr:hypothetical protein [Bacillota bacterium]
MNCESMVYLNKIFSNIDALSCPLLGELTASAETFDQQLSFYEPDDGGCGCGCSCSSCLDFDGDLNFVVDTTQVFISDFTLANPDSLTAADVTVNGIPVDSLEFFNERFLASTNTLMSQISNCACMENGASTKAMLLIRNAGPWLARLTIVVHGSVFGCGGCKRFKLVMTTQDGVSIDIPGSSTFAVTSICLPCTTGGIAPVINFSFKGKASLLNPTITVDTCGGACNVIVTGALVAEPIATIQVTRQTLFSIDAQMVEQPCDDMRRCNQFPGSCTCDSEPLSISNPCCDDGSCGCCGDGRGDDRDGCGCGCGHGTSDERNSDCNDACGRPAPERNKPRQICCQFNGINGCCM